MSKVIIDKFNLSLREDYRQFKRYQNDFFKLMESCYGKSRYWGNEVYLRKIKKRRLNIYLLFNIENKKKYLIGTIFIKPRGKLSGMAILKEFRGKGYSQKLIKQTLADHDHVYAEIPTDNGLLRKLLTDLNFKLVNDKDHIRELLFNEEIQFLNEEKSFISYYHGSDKSKVDRSRKFIMFEFINNN